MIKGFATDGGVPQFQKVLKILLHFDIFCISMSKGHFCKNKQARKLKDAQAEKLTSLQANKLTS